MSEYLCKIEGKMKEYLQSGDRKHGEKRDRGKRKRAHDGEKDNERQRQG